MFVRSTASLSLVTVAAFFLHAVWGCCAHHAHAGVTATVSAIAHHESASESTGQPCSHVVAHNDQRTLDDHNTDRQKPCENGGRPHRACDETGCSFDVPAKVKLVGADIATAFAVLIEPAVSTVFRQSLSQPVPHCPLGARTIANVRQLLQTWLL